MVGPRIEPRPRVLPWNRADLRAGVITFIAGTPFGAVIPFLLAEPDDGSEGPGLAIASAGLMFLVCCGVGLALVLSAAWRRSHPPRHSAMARWYRDPWFIANWRYWDGKEWTDWVV